MSTKQKILDVALTLFAKYGYDGTSMEQIGELVGIKAPSLYKHYKGKEDILNALLDMAESHYEENFGSADNVKIPDSVDEFIESALKSASFTISDPLIRKMRIFLVKEQFRNKRLAQITNKHQIDGLKKMYTRIIEGMMEKGLFKKDDPTLVAMELIAPCVLYVSKADRQPEAKKEALEDVKKQIQHICERYRK